MTIIFFSGLTISLYLSNLIYPILIFTHLNLTQVQVPFIYRAHLLPAGNRPKCCTKITIKHNKTNSDHLGSVSTSQLHVKSCIK